MKKYFNISVQILLLFTFMSGLVMAQDKSESPFFSSELKGEIKRLMDEGDIPGMSVAVIKNGQVLLKNFGFENLESKVTVKNSTSFEIGSCTKAFTALALLRLASEEQIDLNEPITHYLPWLKLKLDGKEVDVTINHFLFHTSGLSFKTLAKIEEGNAPNQLEKTIRSIVGTELVNPPGSTYEYTSINYDVIGLLIEKVSGLSFETYMTKKVFEPLGLFETSLTPNKKNHAVGYKTGFFEARRYDAPEFKGNEPAAYISSTTSDMARWTKIQLGLIHTELDSLILKSHQPDLSVAPTNNISYAFGWQVNQFGRPLIFHEGNNPNFSSFVGFSEKDQIGVVVLTNTNSPNTNRIGKLLYNSIYGLESGEEPGETGLDLMFSILCIVLGIYLLSLLVYILIKLKSGFKKSNGPKPVNKRKGIRIVRVILLGCPFVYGIYLIPSALMGFSWEQAFVWTPISFIWFVVLAFSAIVVTILVYIETLFFPNQNVYKNELPLIAFLGVISGLANTAVLYIITSSFQSSLSVNYLLFYFALAYGLYVLAMKISQTKLINLTNRLTLDIRKFLIHKIVATRFENFEKIEDGKVITTLNNDTSVLANSANIIISFVTNIITILSAFLYMMTISFWSTLIVFGVVLLLVWYYALISKKARVFMEASRNIISKYMSLVNDLNFGFAELSLHRKSKNEFKEEFIDSTTAFKENSVKASIKFLDTTIIGNSFIMIILGILSIVMPRTSLDIEVFTLISFVMVLLYIIGPINVVLETIQEVTRIRVSWSRIIEFTKEIDPGVKEKTSFWEMINVVETAEFENQDSAVLEKENYPKVESLEINELTFSYKSREEDELVDKFSVGPINLSFESGETIFIVGGNGSGKSTFVQLITGLYEANSGIVRINGQHVASKDLGEYFSVLFSGDHLFRKIYGNDLTDREDELDLLLKKLKLEGKVKVEGNTFSTIDLSGGQRKRLGLMKCFLEDRQIFIFDEFAADQDPEFRYYFYRELLPELKKLGKIIIAITHDDQYFDVADRVIKFNYGQVENLDS